jgi:pimeloyl-ACP methyl ester carboxylesterase
MSTAKVGDINIEYYIEGQGPPLLMIMGFSGQASSWSERFLELLRPHFQIIRFSNRGTGLTDKPQVEYSVPMMADDASGLLRELGIEKTHVCGISMGGMIAQELALSHPEQVQALVLGCTTPGGSRGVQPAPEVVALLVPVPGTSPEEQFRKAWPAIVTPEFVEREQEFLEETLRVGLTNLTPVDTMVRQMTAIQAFDTCDRLPQIQAATFIIHGDMDRLIPPQNAEILHEGIPGSTLRLVPGAAHMFFWEKPAESAQAIVEFVSSVPTPA